MTEIKLPTSNYFFNFSGTEYLMNIFSGCIGTDPSLGCMDRTTIAYKVVPIKKEELTLSASIWNQPAWNDNTSEKWKEEQVFDFDGPKSVIQVEEWLNSIAKKHM